MGGFAFTRRGVIYVSDFMGHRIRRVDPVTHLISTLAGTGAEGYNGDGIPAGKASLLYPMSICIDRSGNIFVADSGNCRVRRIEVRTGLIQTVAGTGATPYNGDERRATRANLAYPHSVCVDENMNLYIADTGNHRVRKVDGHTGQIITLAGTGNRGFSGDGASAVDADLDTPQGLALDGRGGLYVADSFNNRVRRVDLETLTIETAAGSGEHGYGGDGMVASCAKLANPVGVHFDSQGNLLIADMENNRIRVVWIQKEHVKLGNR